MPAPASILCEIHADVPLSTDLAHTTRFCASQTGFALEVVSRLTPGMEPVVTLHLTPDQAAPDKNVWCLVCRLACLCPQARVGVLVHASDAFDPARPSVRQSA